jgi:hypothetical protein
MQPTSLDNSRLFHFNTHQLTHFSLPPNVSFLVDEANEPWVFKQKFDFIHTRQLHCAVEEKKLMKQALEYVVYKRFSISESCLLILPKEPQAR